jgi:serine/threonine-protein kinase
MSPESMAKAGLALPPETSVRVSSTQLMEVLPDEEDADLVGQLVAAKYRVKRRIGEGGMGEVFLAEHQAIGKRVALKVLRSEHSQKDEVVARFLLEARSASRIQHANVVQVFDFGQLEDGRFYLALEFLEGIDLADELYRVKILDPARALRIGLQVCSGLGAAHASGVIHRDMKPENVFLTRGRGGSDDVKIVDFGIAKMREISESIHEIPSGGHGDRSRRLTKAGSIFGTPEYMAPEQATGTDIDHRADIYAVGILLYEMLSGKVPFESDSMVQTLTMQVSAPPPPMRKFNPRLSISPELESAVMKALEKAPAARFASMDDFAAALQATPEGTSIFELSLPPGFSMPRPSGPVSEPGPSSSARGSQLSPLPEDSSHSPSQAPLLLTSSRAKTSIDRIDFDDRTSASARVLAERRAPSALIAGLVGAAVALLGLGGGLLWYRHRQAITPVVPVASARSDGPATPSSAPALSAAGQPQAPASIAPVASAAPGPSATTPAGGPVIVLHVKTDPPGAVVRKGGFQVCDATPCDIEAQPNEAVELWADHGDLRGNAKVLARRDQSVQIRLVRSASQAGPRPPTANAAQTSVPGTAGGRTVAPVPMCEFIEGDLKIVKPCK